LRPETPLNPAIRVFRSVISLSHVYHPILFPFLLGALFNTGTHAGIALANARANDRDGARATVLEKENGSLHYNKRARTG
jgi:hypothetical protein